MMADGIHYKILVGSASLDEKILICPASMRAMLNAARSSYAEEKMHALACACMDFPLAVRDTEGMSTLLSLIKQRCEESETDMGERMASYVTDIPIGMNEDMLHKFLAQNPRMLLDFLKYPKDITEVLDEISSKMVPPKYGLRYYQIVASRDISRHLESSPNCVMYHAPTGSGKTRTAMSVVTRHFRTQGPTAVLWLASSTELVDQAANAFWDAWTQHGDIQCMLRLWRGDSPHFNPDREPDRNSMLIAGLQKVALACGNDADLPSKLQKIVSLIVFDEAHQSVAPTYRKVIDGIMQGGKCRLLGLSATPGRSDDAGTLELAAIYQGQKVSIWSPKGMNPIEYLTSNGYLARARFHKINLDGILPQDVPSGNEDYPCEYLGKIGRDMARNEKIVSVVKDAIDNGHRRILVFSPSVDSARMCAAMLKSLHGVCKSDMLDASVRKEKRAGIISRYSDKTDKSVHVIFNYGILTTGFDAPGTSVAVIARPTASVGLYSQMVGRAIRGVDSGGAEEAEIYTVVDTSLPQFGSVAASFDNWNAQWAGVSNG